MRSVEDDDRDDIVWSDAQAIIRGLEERVAVLTRELAEARLLASRIEHLPLPMCSQTGMSWRRWLGRVRSDDWAPELKP
jgi:hypothetical protein